MNYEFYTERVPAFMTWNESHGKFTSIPVLVNLKDGTLMLATCEQYAEDELHTWYSHDSERWVFNGHIDCWTYISPRHFNDKARKKYGIKL